MLTFLLTQHANLEIGNAKVLGSKMDKEVSMEAETGELSSCRNYLMEPRSVGKTMQKGKRLNEKRLEAEESGDYNFHDIKEVSSGTEAHRLGAVKKKFRKKSKKVLFQRGVVIFFQCLFFFF